MGDSALFVELGAIILGLGLLSRIAARLQISAIPFFLLVGLAFGDGGIYPLVTTQEFIDTGAAVGVVLLLLVLGLESSGSELVTSLRENAPAGVVDVIINGLPGVAVALILGWDAKSAVALAGITAISSSGIVARLLDSLRGDEAVVKRIRTTTISLLVLEDLAVAIYLPILAALLTRRSGPSGVAGPVIAVLTLLVALALALRFGGHLSRLLYSKNRESLLLCVLGVGLLVAGGAERLHVSAAVGAFLVGISLSGQVVEGARAVLTPLRDLFAAAFFVFVGLRTDPAAIPDVLVPAICLAFVGVLTKVVTGAFAARRNGLARAEGRQIGALLVARGEFSIVIATIGVQGGLNPRIEALTTAYVLVMGVVGSLAPRGVDLLATKSKERGR